MSKPLHTAYFSESEIVSDFNQKDFEGVKAKIACAIKHELAFGDDDTLIERLACLLGAVEAVMLRNTFRKIDTISDISNLG